MNGAQRHPPNTASPLNRTGVPLPHTSGSPRPSGGLLPNITASLRNVLLHNNNALNHAISQLEVAGDIQSELVAARAAHAKVSMDLRRVTDENMAQGLQLQQAQTDLTVMNQKLHGAREQLRLLESRIANGAGGRSSVQEIYAKRQIEILNLAFDSANQQINELTKKLQMATSAAIVAQTSDSVLPPVDELGTSSARVQDVGKQLAALLKLSDDDFSGTPDQPIPAIEMNTNGEIGKAEKLQILAYFRTLCSECDNLRNSAQAYASRNAALEATLSTIRTLHVEAAPIIPQPSLPPPTPIEGDGEVQMDIERTEAARASRQITQPPTPTQPTHPIHTVSVPSVPTTPSQSTFPQTDIPQRKRQRTSTEASTPEPLPRDDMLHAFVRIVNTTYELKPNEANEGQKRLVCKWCEKRHKEQPEYTVVSFPYDQELPITVPPLPSAELTRTLVRPWVEHVQERHQKVYAKVVENFERIKVKMAAMPARP